MKRFITLFSQQVCDGADLTMCKNKSEVRDMSSSIRDMNKEIITKEDWYEDIMGQLKEVEKFVSNMGWLTFGRDYFLCGEKCFSLQNIIVSLELTAGSIASCVENAVFADAAILIRKYRDDLLF